MLASIQNSLSLQPIKKLCQLAQLPRCTYYRHLRQPRTDADTFEIELQNRIQAICLEFPRYGYRMVTNQLHAEGYQVNHKRILRLMRQDNLLCVRKKHWISTTQSKHRYFVYPNLAQGHTVDGPNQLWVADITYIRLTNEFIYLAVLLDAFSRLVIGWALDRTLETSLTLTALKMALGSRLVHPGLIHHSDRGIQYASDDYTTLLRHHSISMSRKGNPFDNAKVESFIKTLKQNEVYLADYQSLDDAQTNIGHFLQSVYNKRRLHSSLGYHTPQAFEDRYYAHSNLEAPFVINQRVSL
jgi:transposase InsO family protein